jgi:hypothetical protein
MDGDERPFKAPNDAMRRMGAKMRRLGELQIVIADQLEYGSEWTMVEMAEHYQALEDARMEIRNELRNSNVMLA